MGATAVIADTSVLVLFARAGRLDLLERLFGEVKVPEHVDREAFRPRELVPDMVALQAAIDSGWLVVCTVDAGELKRLRHRFRTIDAGELACLALARTERGQVLLDDHQGRRAAQVEGIPFTGSLGILTRAWQAKVLPERGHVADALRQLLAAGLWVDAALVETFWSRVGGRA